MKTLCPYIVKSNSARLVEFTESKLSHTSIELMQESVETLRQLHCFHQPTVWSFIQDH